MGLFGLNWFGGEDSKLQNDMAVGMEKPLVQFAGSEYMPGDAKAIKAFENHVEALKTMPDTGTIKGTNGEYYSAESPQGQAEIVKADLQIRHGLSAEQATKAVKSVPELNVKPPQQMIFIKGGKPTDQVSENSQAPPPKANPGKFAGKATAAKT